MRYACYLVLLFFITGTALNARQAASEEEKQFVALSIDIRDQLSVFKDRQAAIGYRIRLCADVPDNKKPLRPAYRQETGHVFLILEQVLTAGDTVAVVFGFYPWRGLPSLLFRKARARIKDNSNREYDAEISRQLTAAQFDTAISTAILLSQKTYHLNRYNCYDYAVQVFNAAYTEHPLPLVYVKFPFPFGKGGSPCSVYKDLQRIKQDGSYWAPVVRFGRLVAPVSRGRLK